MSFWIIIGVLAVLATAILATALLRKRHGEEPAAAYDLRVYRDQLREVERDLARGVLSEADAERVRAEVSRRILTADAALQKARQGQGQPVALSIAAAATSAMILLGGSLWLYQRMGAPGYGDLPQQLRIEQARVARTDRPGQATAEAQTAPAPAIPDSDIPPRYKDLVTRLRDTVTERPDDLQGQRLLARHEAVLGNFSAAHAAQAQVLRLLGDEARASDHTDYADMLILSAGGYVSPEAEAALAAALTRNPGDGSARYYWGLMQGQTGRPDQAFRIWARLLSESPPDAPWIPPIRAQIEDMAQRAGERFELPPGPGPDAAPLSGPDAADIAAAEQMSAQDRSEMVRGMVAQLSERLATEGGSPQEWARLIRALGVIGETDRARAIRDEALQVFATDAAATDLIRDAAAGLDE